MRFLGVFDTGSGSNHRGESIAYNLYQCDDCGMLCRENVWDHAGILWIDTNNTVEFEAK